MLHELFHAHVVQPPLVSTYVMLTLTPTLGSMAFSYAAFGRGTGPILLDDVHCVGDEESILECPSLPHGEHNCGHYEDASVGCTCVYIHTLQNTCVHTLKSFLLQLVEKVNLGVMMVRVCRWTRCVMVSQTAWEEMMRATFNVRTVMMEVFV